jgi:hypothetical protein
MWTSGRRRRVGLSSVQLHKGKVNCTKTKHTEAVLVLLAQVVRLYPHPYTRVTSSQPNGEAARALGGRSTDDSPWTHNRASCNHVKRR